MVRLDYIPRVDRGHQFSFSHSIRVSCIYMVVAQGSSLYGGGPVSPPSNNNYTLRTSGVGTM